MESTPQASSLYQVIYRGSRDWARTTPRDQDGDEHRYKGKGSSSDFAALGEKTLSLPLISDKSSISRMFVKGLVQGIVYGFAASSLFFFFLVLFA